MDELTNHHKNWNEEKKAIISKVANILEESECSQEIKISIECSIGRATAINYSIENYLISRAIKND